MHIFFLGGGGGLGFSKISAGGKKCTLKKFMGSFCFSKVSEECFWGVPETFFEAFLGSPWARGP